MVFRRPVHHGTRFLHILSPCPPGWKHPDEATIEIARMAVLNRTFPLVEVEDGKRWRFTADHPGDPVEPWIRKQGRFHHLSDEQIAATQAEVDERWKLFERRVEHGT